MASLLVRIDEAVESDDGGAVARERVVGVPEERQPVVDVAEGIARLGELPVGDVAREHPGRLQHEVDWIDRLRHRKIPARESDGSRDVVAIVADYAAEPTGQLHSFGTLAAIEADRFGGVAQ